MSSFPKNSEGALAAGQMLGRYELLSPIGRGGMGNVWAARLKGARGFRKLFAVKTILNVLDHPRLEQMLFEEATLASQIQHPNVVETIELGEHEGQLYLVMDLIDGESLSFILRKAIAEGGVPLPVAVNLVGQVCRGLQAAHDLTDEDGKPVGLVHRDISPPNVLVTYSGTVKIVDFGVAITSASKTFDSKEIKGKVSYFAPEQLRAQPLDARVDVFATAIMLYLLTTNRHPFRSGSESDTISRILSSAQVTPPSAYVENYPEALETALLRALEKERDRRYASAAAFLEALETAVPSAFGPAGDKHVTEYIQGLLRDRILERRHVLRAAEDGAESSSPRASVLSVPAVVTARVVPVKSSRTGGVALLAALVTIFGTVLTLQNFASAPRQRSEAAPIALTRPAAPLPEINTTQPQAPAARPLEQPALAAFPVQISARSAGPMTRSAVTRTSARIDRSDEALRSPPPEASKTEPNLDLVESNAIAVSSGLGSVAAPVPPPAASLPAPVAALAPSGAKPPRVRQVASKLGHARLAVNPSSEPYRVRLPPALPRNGQTFDATVNICVSPSGSVSSVKFVHSAGPLIDQQVLGAVSRWRYRPLLESEEPVPFCYVLRYQFAAR